MSPSEPSALLAAFMALSMADWKHDSAEPSPDDDDEDANCRGPNATWNEPKVSVMPSPATAA